MTTDRQWLNSLSREEYIEIYDDAVFKYKASEISEREFRLVLIKLGFNASTIEDEVKEHQPL